jgi:PAS domain S-box-containing protein
MTSDKKIAVMNRLLEEMAYLGRRLNELEGTVSNNWKVIEAFSEENKRYRDVLEALPQRFFLKDEELHYILCSEIFATDLNKTTVEVIGQVEENLVPAELAKIRRQQEMRILQSGQAEEAEEILIINGQQRVFITIKAPIKNGRISGIFGVSVDISAYWRRLEELGNLNRQMEILLEGQSQQIVGLQSNLDFALSGMRRQEEAFFDLRVDYEKQLSSKDVELARLRNEIQNQPSERDEMIQILKRKLCELQNVVDGAQEYMGRLQNAPD